MLISVYSFFSKLYYNSDSKIVPPSYIFLFGAAPKAYGGSQARGRIGAVASSLRQNHSNAGPEPHLWPTPQLRTMQDP